MVELGVRYRAGREPVTIICHDGSVAQLKPFASIRFEKVPREIKGKLSRVWHRRPLPETKPVA